MLGPMLERIRAEAVEAAKAEVRAELAGVSAPKAEPERGLPGPARGPGSRYTEAGIRVRKHRLGGNKHGTKIASAFMAPAVIEAFRNKVKEYGMTQRYAAEQAF